MGPLQFDQRQPGPLGQSAEFLFESRIGMRRDRFPGRVERLVRKPLGIAPLHELGRRMHELDCVPLGQLSQFLSHLIRRPPHNHDRDFALVRSDRGEITVAAGEIHNRQRAGDSQERDSVLIFMSKLSKKREALRRMGRFVDYNRSAGIFRWFSPRVAQAADLCRPFRAFRHVFAVSHPFLLAAVLVLFLN